MKPRVCICCGKPISEKGNALSRNPNLCASCSSLTDGMEEAEAPESLRATQELLLAGEKTTETLQAA